MMATRRQLEEQRAQAAVDLAEVDEQLAAGEFDAATAERMRARYRRELERIADQLVKDDLLEHRDNPRHPRWKRVRATARGRKVYTQLEKRRRSWSQGVIADLSAEELELAANVLRKIRTRLAAAPAE